MSTNSVAMVRKINAAFAEKNLYMRDSPVSGSHPRGGQRQDGNLGRRRRADV
jgi:3-hydroxyisobutyrate dehydrogenase-like beta-hydroxyacid dehydrogenase